METGVRPAEYGHSIEPRDLDYEGVLLELAGWYGRRVSVTVAASSGDCDLLMLVGRLQNATEQNVRLGRPNSLAGEVLYFNVSDNTNPAQRVGVFTLNAKTFTSASVRPAERPPALEVLTIATTSTVPDDFSFGDVDMEPLDGALESLESLRVLWMQRAGMIRTSVSLLPSEGEEAPTG